MFHDKAEITQQGNLLDPHEHVDDPRVHALSNMLFQIQISPGPIFIKKQIQTRFARKKRYYWLFILPETGLGDVTSQKKKEVVSRS